MIARVNQQSAPEDKIALFGSLFRGRSDVYPRRFESRKTGRSGYQPACANEWVRGLCDKRAVKCAKCPHRRFLPVTDEVIRWHLSGQDGAGRDFVMGAYPMLLDETCFFLAVDFDTVTRKDGHHPIVLMQCGPIRHHADAKAQAAARPFAHAVGSTYQRAF